MSKRDYDADEEIAEDGETESEEEEELDLESEFELELAPDEHPRSVARDVQALPTTVLKLRRIQKMPGNIKHHQKHHRHNGNKR